jgi:hypothetical protein
VTSRGSAYARFRRALKTGNLTLIRNAAAELPRVDLGDALEEYLSAVPQLRGEDRKLDEFTSQHTVRAEFNDRVAAGLNLPYLASSVRLAPASELVRSHNKMLKALRRAAAVGTPGLEPTPASSYLAPFLLGVVLDEMDSPGEFGAKLGELRDEFSGFREWIRYHPDRKDWHEQPQSLYADFPKKLAETLSPTATRGKTTIATIQGAASFTPAKPAVDAAANVVKAARESPAVARRLARAFRPEVYTLLSVSADASQMPVFDAQIRRIWGGGLRVEDEDALKEIAGFKGDELLTPRALD